MRRPRLFPQRLVRGQRQRRMLSAMLGSATIASTMRAILYTGANAIWRGLVATPPSSLLETVVLEFKSKSAIPLELPFMSTLALAAQCMAQAGATLELNHRQTVHLDLYTLVLARSGRCKSHTYRIIREAAEAAGWSPRSLDDSGSSSALLEGLEKADGKPILWRLDEFGEFWRSLTSEHHRQTKRYILLAYDHDPITHTLKAKSRGPDGEKISDSTKVTSCCLGIYATSVTENLSQQLTAEDWRSGLVQRFALVVGNDDPERPWYHKNYAFLDNIDGAKLASAWRKALQTPILPRYELGVDARKAVADAFFLFGRDSGMGEDFVRRAEYRILKYGVIFHWLLGKPTEVIDAEDVGWGARLAALHLSDIKYLLDSTEYQDYVDLFARTVRLQERLGPKFNPRMIRMHLRRYVSGMEEANALYRLVIDRPPEPFRTGSPDQQK